MSKQTSNEPYAFVMYDTKNGSHAKSEYRQYMIKKKSDNLSVCPHVSFRNPQAPENAPPRQSVETRSIVITKED